MIFWLCIYLWHDVQEGKLAMLERIISCAAFTLKIGFGGCLSGLSENRATLILVPEQKREIRGREGDDGWKWC